MSRSRPSRHRLGRHPETLPWREYPAPILDLIPAVPYPSNSRSSSSKRLSHSKGKRIFRGSNGLNHLNGLNVLNPIPYALVPPTVRPSILMVGSPTPTGTDWPSLPHVPTPSSSFKSEPTIDTRVRTSGPLPINVAPLTGLVTFPSSIK